MPLVIQPAWPLCKLESVVCLQTACKHCHSSVFLSSSLSQSDLLTCCAPRPPKRRSRRGHAVAPCRCCALTCLDLFIKNKRLKTPARAARLTPTVWMGSPPPVYRQPLPAEPYAYGGLSCVISAVITNPVDVAKIRMQIHSELSAAAAAAAALPRARPGLTATVASIVRDEGLLGLSRGVTPSMLREASYSTIRLAKATMCRSPCRCTSWFTLPAVSCALHPAVMPTNCLQGLQVWRL